MNQGNKYRIKYGFQPLKSIRNMILHRFGDECYRLPYKKPMKPKKTRHTLNNR